MSETGAGAPEQGGSRGTPSASLAESGLVDGADPRAGGGDYESLTEAASEVGVFTLVGGYLDEDTGEVHREIRLRSMSGDEEDLLGNRSINILDRVSEILVACTERLGTLTERGKIAQAIHRLPLGTRTHAVIALRRTTHWKRHKDMYEMEVRCPIQGCQKIGSYAVNLAELETHEMPHPDKRVFTVKLGDSGQEVTWRVATSSQEKVLDAVTDMEESRLLTFVILVRLNTIDGQDVRLGLDDLLASDRKKIRLSKRGQELFDRVRKWSVGDREDVRESILEEEPSVDTEIEFECKHCHRPFSGKLDIGQQTFFFPSATSRLSKKRRST